MIRTAWPFCSSNSALSVWESTFDGILIIPRSTLAMKGSPVPSMPISRASNGRGYLQGRSEIALTLNHPGPLLEFGPRHLHDHRQFRIVNLHRHRCPFENHTRRTIRGILPFFRITPPSCQGMYASVANSSFEALSRILMIGFCSDGVEGTGCQRTSLFSVLN